MSIASVPTGASQSARAVFVPPARTAAVVATQATGDVLAVTLAAAAALWVRIVIIGALTYRPYLRLFLLVMIFFPIAYAYTGLYPGYGVGPVERSRRLFRSTTLVSLLALLYSLLLKETGLFSRVVLMVWWGFNVALVPLVRMATQAALSRIGWWGAPALVLGAGKTGEMVARKLLHDPGLGLRPVAFLDDDSKKQGSVCAGLPVKGPLRLAPKLARAWRIGLAVVAMPGLAREDLLRIVEDHAVVFPRILIIPDLWGLTSLGVEARDLQGVLGLEVRQNLLHPWNRVLKRAADLAVALPLLMLTLPFILAACAAIRLRSPGPGFYTQEREGLLGRRVRVLKIRTMVPDAEAVLENYLCAHPEAGQEWQAHMKLRADPRIIPGVGRFLRRFSLDELPQLWNVVKGEMSLVGPRPFPDYHLRKFPETFRQLRRKVPPGLTGLWQVSERSEGDLGLQEDLDTYYIRNWSLWLDVYLLARTARAVLFGKGAY